MPPNETWQKVCPLPPAGFPSARVAIDAGYVLLVDKVTVSLAVNVCESLERAACANINPILLEIHSGGGDVDAGKMIIAKMRELQGRKDRSGKPFVVATSVPSMAASMAAVIASCGTEGERYVGPHARVMIHQASSRASGSMQPGDAQVMLDQLKVANKYVIDTIKGNCNTTKATQMIDGTVEQTDLWVTAEVARDINFAQKIGAPRLAVATTVAVDLVVDGAP